MLVEGLLKFLVIVLPFVLILTMAASYVTKEVKLALEQAHIIAQDQIGAVIGRNISISSINIFPLGKATVNYLDIPDVEKDQKLIGADRIEVEYNLKEIANGRGAEAVKKITVYRPTINLVRRSDGSLNVLDLLPPDEGPAGPPFKGAISVKNAEISYTDLKGIGNARKFQIYLFDLDTQLDARSEPVYRILLSAKSDKKILDSLRVSAELDQASQRIVATVEAAKISLPAVAEIAGITEPLILQNGTASVNARLALSTTDNNIDLKEVSAAISFENVNAQTSDHKASIEMLTGSAVLADEKMAVNFGGKFAGSQAKVSGTIAGFEDPNLDLLVNLSSIDLDSALELLNLPKEVEKISLAGRGKITAHLKGSISDPYVEATGFLPVVKYSDYTVNNMTFDSIYSRGIAKINRLNFTYRGSTIGVTGAVSDIRSESPFLNARAWVRKLDLESLQLLDNISVSGVVGLDITAHGKLFSPKILATVNVSNPKYNDPEYIIEADKLYARLAYRDSTLNIREMVASGLFDGVVTAQGDVSQSQVAIDISAKHVDCGEIGNTFGIDDIAGYGFLDARIFGETHNPEIDAFLEAFSLQYTDYSASYLKAKLTGNKESLNIMDGVLLRTPTDISFTAQLADLETNDIRFDVKALVNRLDIQNSLQMLHQGYDISGIASGTLDATGVFQMVKEPETFPISNAKGSLTINVADGAAYGYPLVAQVNASYDNDLLNLSKVVLKSDKTELVAEGSVQPFERNVTLDFNVEDMDLSELRSVLGDSIVLAGTGDASGTVRGLWTDPLVNISGYVDDFTINGLMWESTSFDSSYRSGSVTDTSVEIKRGKQEVHVSAEQLDLANQYLTGGKVLLTDISASEIWNAFMSSFTSRTQVQKTAGSLPRITSGTINGELSIDGDLEKQQGVANLDIKDIGLDVDVIESVELIAALDDGVVNLEDFLAKIGEGTVSASGYPFYSKGNVNADFSIRNLDLNALRPFMGSNTPGGILEAEFIAQGNYKSPFVRGSLEVVRPSFGKLMLDGLRAGDVRVSLDKSELDDDSRNALEGKQAIVLADDAVLAFADHQLNIGGFVPWDWETFAIPNDLPLNVTASVHNQNLSTLAQLSQLLDDKNTFGILDGAFDLSGTLSNYQFGGQIRLENGQVAVRDFKNKFDNINLDIGFVDGDKLTVNQLSVGSDLGGRFYVVPGSHLVLGGSEGVQANMQLVADNFRVGEKNFAGMTEDIVAQVDVGVAVEGPMMEPKIYDKQIDNAQGGISISNAKLVFAIPEKSAFVEAQTFAFNPTFDLSMRFGKNVLVQPPALKVEPDGGGTITGSLNNPNVNLDIGIKEGHMALAARRMRVTPGGSLKVIYSPPTDKSQRANYVPDVDVDFEATTTLTAENSFGKRERYQVFLTADGGINNMNVHLRSKPEGLSKERILAELGHFGALGSGGVEIEKELTNVLSAVGSSTFFSPIETMFVEQLGFEQFTLDYSRTADTSLYFSRELPANFYVSYFQTLKAGLSSSDNTQFELKLGYRPRGLYQVTVGVDDEQRYSLELSVSKLFN